MSTHAAKRLTDEFPEKAGQSMVLISGSKLNTVNTRPGSGRPHSARTGENAKLLLQKFPQSATDFVPPIVRRSDLCP